MPPASKPPAHRGRGGQQRLAALAEGLSSQLPISCAFIRTERRTSAITGPRSVSSLGQERIQEARGAGVVGAPLGAPLEQPAVLEEDVHELPQHVVERSRPAPGARTGRRAGGELHSAPRARGDRQAAARRRARRAPPHPSASSPRPRRRSRCRPGSRAARPARPAARPRARARSPAARACRRSPGARTRPRRGARRSARRASGRTRAAARRGRSARPSGGRAARCRSASAAKNRRLASVRSASSASTLAGRRRPPHAGAPARVASRTSQSRTSASTPSPVRALTSMCGTPGWTPSRW